MIEPIRVGGDRLRLAREAFDRAQGGARNHDPQQGRERDPTGGGPQQQQ